MGISADGCTLVDESDGTVVDDDDVLLMLVSKDKTFILLDRTEEWIPSTSHQPKPVDSDAATQRSTTKKDTESDVSLQEPSCRTTTEDEVIYFEFMNELQLTNRCDLEHLTTVARSLVSLNITREQWRFMWENQTFLDFMDNCARHPPAEMHVVVLLRSNETAKKLAPENVLAKFNITPSSSATDVSVPRRLDSSKFKKDLHQRHARLRIVTFQTAHPKLLRWKKTMRAAMISQGQCLITLRGLITFQRMEQLLMHRLMRLHFLVEKYFTSHKQNIT